MSKGTSDNLIAILQFFLLMACVLLGLRIGANWGLSSFISVVLGIGLFFCALLLMIPLIVAGKWFWFKCRGARSRRAFKYASREKQMESIEQTIMAQAQRAGVAPETINTILEELGRNSQKRLAPIMERMESRRDLSVAEQRKFFQEIERAMSEGSADTAEIAKRLISRSRQMVEKGHPLTPYTRRRISSYVLRALALLFSVCLFWLADKEPKDAAYLLLSGSFFLALFVATFFVKR